MGQLLQLVIGLLACLALASASPGLFHRENITTYRYYADVKTGNIEPNPYASQFVLSGLMHVKPATIDPSPKNAFYIALNVTHAVRNGEIQHFERIPGNTSPIPDAAMVLNDPFVVVFDNSGRVDHMMVGEAEAGWSRNIKRSIASMLQLDLSSMQLEVPIKPHGFVTKENTIYGDCAVNYDVHRRVHHEENHFTVTKFMEPMSCEKFRIHTSNSRESEACLVDKADEMTTASRRVFHIENAGDDLLIRSLVAHGVINYFPMEAKSEAHYVLANQSMEFESLMPMDSIPLQALDMKKMVILNDLAFQKPESAYAVHAGIDYTYGRHVVNLDDVITKVIRMLGEAVDYISENHVEMESPEMKHGQTMNRLLNAMNYMDLPSLEHVFNNIAEGTTPRDVTIMNFFLNMVPNVGTNATCLFTRNIIRKRKIPDAMANMMLTKLALNIRMPSEELLVEMENIMRFGDEVSTEVRRAGILCFSIMIYQVYRHHSQLSTMHPKLLDNYVQHYFDHMMNESTYGMKIVYMQGLRNIEVGGVHTLLEPFIRGEQQLSDRPDHFRFQAMFVNWKVARHADYIHDLYWPILANTTLPLTLRICAYSVIIEQPPRMDRMMNLYWLMVYEKNEHLYNFHYTIMKSLAESVSPCMSPMKEMARKLLRFIRVRPVSNIVTGAWRVGYENKMFGFGESMRVMLIADEQSGKPMGGTFGYTNTKGRKPVNDFGFVLRMEGLEDVIAKSIWETVLNKPVVPLDEVRNLLKKAAEDMPSSKPVHIEFAVEMQRRTVFMRHWRTVPSLAEILEMMSNYKSMIVNWQHINFDELYSMQVPNDLGLPTLLENKIPHVISMKASNQAVVMAPLLSVKLESIIKSWRHGYHSMDVYNPILDTWHSIRRVSSFDNSLAMQMRIGYNLETKSVKVTFPRLPVTEYSISGMRSYVKNYVLVMGAETEVLERYCKACNPVEQVTRGVKYRKNITLMNLDSKDTGLHYSASLYDCERFGNPKTRAENVDSIFEMDNKNTMDNSAIQAMVSLREYFMYHVLSPEMGTCGYLVKMEPSITYPMSEVDLTMRGNIETPVTVPLSYLLPMKLSLRGQLDNKLAATNVSTQSWTINANLGITQGHVNNQLQIQLTRTIPGQKDLKICIDGHKIYPATDIDPLNRVIITKQEIIGKMTITMGETEDGNCVRDAASLTINMKGEMSAEQKEALQYEVNGLCQKDVDNPYYKYTESSIVPRTRACLNEALLRTNLRKYGFTVLYKNIPESVMSMGYWMLDTMQSDFRPYLTYLPIHTEPGIVKISIEYPLSNEGMDLVVRTPSHEMKYTGIPGDPDPHGWADPMDNTRFSQNFLAMLRDKTMEFCTVYPEIMMNFDGAIFPFVVPGDWTLVTGDHIRYTYAVLVKYLEPGKLGLMVSIANHTMEVIPSATVPTITVDGKVVDYESGVLVSQGNETDSMRAIWSHDRLVIDSSFTPVILEWTQYSVTLAMSTMMQGKVTGICGHLDGDHKDHMAKVYTIGT